MKAENYTETSEKIIKSFYYILKFIMEMKPANAKNATVKRWVLYKIYRSDIAVGVGLRL